MGFASFYPFLVQTRNDESRMASLMNALILDNQMNIDKFVFGKHFYKIILLQLNPFYSDGDRYRGSNALENEEFYDLS